MTERRKNGARYDIVAVAEGAKPIGGQEMIKGSKKDGFGHEQLGGIGAQLAKEIDQINASLPKDFQLPLINLSAYESDNIL